MCVCVCVRACVRACVRVRACPVPGCSLFSYCLDKEPTKLCVNTPKVAETSIVEVANHAQIHFRLRRVVACVASVAESISLSLAGVTFLTLDTLDMLSVLTVSNSLVASLIGHVRFVHFEVLSHLNRRTLISGVELSSP